ncbi:MAG: hypothetical protein R3185_02525 [Candidatus Thermoplasmatota archaeon]|nr:hypothetical protein [Candidatus Thermoplasmatota archaeon]
MAEARLYVCPKCGSLEVQGDHLAPLGQLYRCLDCGYQGSFVIEAETPEDAQRISRELSQERG